MSPDQTTGGSFDSTKLLWKNPTNQSPVHVNTSIVASKDESLSAINKWFLRGVEY